MSNPEEFGFNFDDLDAMLNGQFFANAGSPANGEPENVIREPYTEAEDAALQELRNKLAGSGKQEPVPTESRMPEPNPPVIPVESNPVMPVEITNPDSGEIELEDSFEAIMKLNELEGSFAAVEAEFADDEAALNALDEEEQELRRQIEEIRARKSQYSVRRQEYNRKVRDMRREQDVLKQDIDLEKKKRLRLRELEAEKSTFDERTLEAIWRISTEYPAMKHQFEGAYYMAAAKRGIIADEMGLGKTLEAVMMMDMLGARRILILCPTDVMSGFRDAIARWAPHRAPIILGRQPKAIQQGILEGTKFMKDCTIIMNYEAWNFNKNLLTWLINAEFDSIICDEAHRLKGGSKRDIFMGVAEIMKANTLCPNCGWRRVYGTNSSGMCNVCGTYLEPSITNALMMTGTPILNEPEEIYPLLNLCYPETFYRLSTFRDQFCAYDRWNQKWVWQPGGEAKLAQKISGFYIRRTMTDAGIKLPPLTPYVHEIEITEEDYPLQFALLNMLHDDAAVQIRDGSHVTVNDVLSLILRQRQATVWPGNIWMKRPKLDEAGYPVWDFDTNSPAYEKVYVGQDYRESAKLDKAIELAHEFTAMGKRWVVMSQFKGAIKQFVELYGEGCVEYDGDTPQRIQELVKTNFDRQYLKANPNEPIRWEGMAAQYQKGGIGITLTAATAMIILDEEWNEGKILQAYARIQRIGQTEETTVHILQHTGPGYSIDSWLSRIIERKRKIVGGFNEANETLGLDEWKQAFGNGE